MSRLALALCALLPVVTPRVAHPSITKDFQRPDVYRYAINAVIGDASCLNSPLPVDPDRRVRAHLDFVHALLSLRDTSNLSATSREARRENLDHLREYIDAGRFPRNHLYEDENRPCFIDRDGRICAVGYLVEQSAGRELAERINAEFQSEFLWRMDMPELDRWIATSGLSLVDLCMIQPTYEPVFDVEVTWTSDRVPTTLTIKGEVVALGWSCQTKYLEFAFGDGATWTSAIFNSRVVPVDIQHVYTEPGAYTIVGTGVSTDSCGNLRRSKTWQVSFDPQDAITVSVSPNPFNPATTLAYTLPAHGVASVTIYDVRGHRVATLIDQEPLDSGEHWVRWGGTTDLGRPAPSGIYFAQVEQNAVTRTRKLLLIK
jgi:hypothetical protein